MRVPPELLYHVTRQLFYYQRPPTLRGALYSRSEAIAKDALLACSQVSHAMRQATLPFLFHTLAFSISLYKGLGYVGCTCRSSSLRDERANCTAIAVYVREVRVRMRCPDPECSSEDVLNDLEVEGEPLFAFFGSFPGLQVVYVESAFLYWGSLLRVEPIRPLAVESFSWNADIPGIEHLPIETDIIDTLAAFSEVEHVEFRRMGFYDPEWQRWLGNRKRDRRPVRITSLRISECKDAGDLLTYLHAVSAIQPNMLKSLFLSPVTERCLPSLSRFLGVFGTNLEQLELDIFELDKFTAQCEYIIFASTTQL